MIPLEYYLRMILTVLVSALKTMFPIIWKNDKNIFKDPFKKIGNFLDAGLTLTTSVGPAIGARNCFLILTLAK